MSESAPLEIHGPSSVVDAPIVSELEGDAKLTRGGISWSIFQGGRDPYVILMTIYIFMPYVASGMVGDPVKGQELISRFQQYAGWIVMATAPFLGALAATLLTGEQLGWSDGIAMAVMATGVALLLRERHGHGHTHDPLDHTHAHVHDEHHRHPHGPDDPPGEPHAHAHHHAPLTHDHPHAPDVHHRHRH